MTVYNWSALHRQLHHSPNVITADAFYSPSLPKCHYCSVSKTPTACRYDCWLVMQRVAARRLVVNGLESSALSASCSAESQSNGPDKMTWYVPIAALRRLTAALHPVWRHLWPQQPTVAIARVRWRRRLLSRRCVTLHSWPDRSQPPEHHDRTPERAHAGCRCVNRAWPHQTIAVCSPFGAWVLCSAR